LLVVGSVGASALAIARAFPFDQWALLATAGVLIPLWGLWIAIRAPRLMPPESGTLEAVPT
jgi:hypothetical protein